MVLSFLPYQSLSKTVLESLLILYPHFLEKVRVNCCYAISPARLSVRQSVTVYFLKLLLHLIKQQ